MRADQPDGALRGCPLCGTKVSDASLGLRDFAWLNNELPGRIGGMDIDLILTNNKAGLAMAFELKPENASVSLGARMTLKFLVQHGIRCMVVWDQGDGYVEVSEMTRDGDLEVIRGQFTQPGFALWVCEELEFCP